jgi:hypothetical protein
MPQEMIVVYHSETGKPELMHSVDAAEAVNLGDYTYAPPQGAEVSTQDMAAARAKAQGWNSTVHPELMSPEDRDAMRQEANQRAQVQQMTGTLQAGTPVIVVPQSEALPTSMQDRRRGASRADEAPAVEHTTAARATTPDAGKK